MSDNEATRHEPESDGAHGTPAGPRFRPPKLAEHTREILGELGRSAEQIEAFVAEGVVH